MCKTIKIIFLTIAFVAVTLVGIFIGRGKADRRGVSDDTDRSDNIRSGIDRSEEGNREVQSKIDASRKHNNSASDRIGNAQDQLRAAIEILRAAKKKE